MPLYQAPRFFDQGLDAGFCHYGQELLHGPVHVGPLVLGTLYQGISEVSDIQDLQALWLFGVGHFGRGHSPG